MSEAEARQVVRRAKIVAIVVVLGLAIGAGRTLFVRSSNARALEAETAQLAKTYVKVGTPTLGGAESSVTLPGTLQGFVQSPISARASGYLKRWTRDIGSRVEKGELLAEIESPEIDQQLSQAIAARQQAEAGLALARSTLKRWEELRTTGMVPQQQLDERRGAEAQAVATLAAAEANVERLRQLQAFKRITAPFSGVITKRNVDVGDLIDAGAARPLFVLTQTDPLRVYLDVPQAYAHLVKTGQPVTIRQSEIRGKEFRGEVARTAGSIDAATRTMQVEVALSNRDGALLPGAYVQATLALKGGGGIVVPANALMFRGEGMHVAAVDDAGKVKLMPVKLGRNYGQSVEVLQGIKGNERLVLNPSDSLAEGDVVQVVTQDSVKK
jgi:RND family efflux transporter MFP subunit